MAEQQETLNEPPKLGPMYKIRSAQPADAKQMAELYKTIFKTYPTPIFKEEYIRECMENNTNFTVATFGGRIVSAASADVFSQYNSAEITDCATYIEHRGQGLLSAIIFDLEQRMKDMKLNNLFSLTRALSTGMNMVMSKLGFVYNGRLIQNSQISGQFEDMNIWYKDL